MNISVFRRTILLSYISIASASAAVITPALPAIQQYFPISHGSITWIVTIFLIGYTMGQLLYGPLANHFGKLFSLRIGLLINILGIGVCLIALLINSYRLLLLGRLITALGAASGLSCTFMLIHSYLSQEQAKKILSFAVVSFTLGIGLAVLVGGIITQYLTWQACFILLLIHGIIALISTCLFTEVSWEKKLICFTTLTHGYRQALSQKKLFLFSSILGLVSVVSYTYSAAAPLIADTYLKLSAAEYGYWNSLNMIGMLAGGISAATMLTRFGTKDILYSSLAGLNICLVSLITLALLHIQSPLWFFITTTLMYFFTSWLFPCASFLATRDIADKASASSMMSFINMAAAALSVLVMGYLPMNILCAFIMVIFIYLILIMFFYMASMTHTHV